MAALGRLSDCIELRKRLASCEGAKTLSDYGFHRLPYRSLVLALLPVLLASCSGMVTSATTRLGENISSAILSQDDPATVKQGAPAYLLLIDGLIRDDPDNVQLLLLGAKLYSTYAGAFVDDPERAKRLTTHARAYATHALCQQNPHLCPLLARPYAEFRRGLTALTVSDVPALYTWAASWASWIQAHKEDWNAVAELPKVEAAMERIIELDETFEEGGPHLYLGILLSLRPPALGGKPEKARAHFERAIELSGGRNLMAKVLFAKYYARLVFDRSLHDRLLHEVLAADPKDPGHTFSNALAKEEAQRLLASAANYF